MAEQAKDYIDESDEPMIDAITKKLLERIKVRQQERDGEGEQRDGRKDTNVRGGNPADEQRDQGGRRTR
jgi:hypothetical protein